MCVCVCVCVCYVCVRACACVNIPPDKDLSEIIYNVNNFYNSCYNTKSIR